MGGGEKEKGKEGEGDSTSSLSMEVVCEYMKLPVVQSEATVMARLKAVRQDNDERRAPVSICAAIDRSGSMKEHLPLLKETLEFMVQQLRPEDRLCLVTFDHEVCVELPLTAMSSAGKLQAEKAIKAVKERGTTNLSGGLLAALEALYRVPEAEASLVESVLLFTDGKANIGIRDKAAIAKATRSLLTQIGRQACVFTLGYGSEHDADLLHAVADAGNGLFYYIDNADSIPESFCDCLGGLLSVAAQNVRLTFTAAHGVRLSKPITSYRAVEKERGRVYEVTIPDVYCEEEKCTLVKLSVAGDSSVTEPQTSTLVSCSAEYFDVLQSRQTSLTVNCDIVRNPRAAHPLHSDDAEDIELHRIRCEVANALGQANTLADSGNIPRAREILRRMVVRVRGSIVAGRPLAVHFLETLQESIDGIKDKVTFEEHGKPVMMNYAGSHWQQRSNLKPSHERYQRSKAGVLSLPHRDKAGASSLPHQDEASAVSAPVFLSPYRISSKMSMISKHSSSRRSS